MAVKAVKAGAVDFVQKPYRRQQLLDAIDEALRRDADARSAPAPPPKLAPAEGGQGPVARRRWRSACRRC